MRNRAVHTLQAELNDDLRRLFRRMTGLNVSVLWHRIVPDSGRIACVSAVNREASGRPIPRRCQRCLSTRWDEDADPGPEGRRFTGRCGRLNFWCQIQAEGGWLARLLIQTPPPRRQPGLKNRRGLVPGDPSDRRRPRRNRTEAFGRATELLRFVAHELELSVCARRLAEELSDARRAQVALSREDERWRAALHERLPQIRGRPERPAPGARAERIVTRMVEYVHEHHHQPMRLGQLAQALHRNASYLSTLFVRVVGISFHHYLDEVRLARAKELLNDPLCCVADVACAVGYASEDWFRHAFKRQTGLAPSEWRARTESRRQPNSPST